MDDSIQPNKGNQDDTIDGASVQSSATIVNDNPTSKKAPNNNNEWGLLSRVQEQHQRDLTSGFKPQELGVTWKDLNVNVISADDAVVENVFSQFNIPTHIKESRNKPPLRTILKNSHGCVKPGEMLLVLGRPGSGCTTLLKMLANRRGGFKSIDGDVRFGSLTSDEAHDYRGQIVMNTEEELFFPSLTVGQTMDFACRLKVPFKLPNGVESSEAYTQESKEFLMESMGISHTVDTKVGNEFVRGVSGGERKRVSIIECMATRGSVFCWDNSTRGLDASTALEWTKAIRAMTDTLGLSTIVTLYQAGNGIYEQFDKVLVLDEGEQVYYGPRADARPFMEEAGFVCREGSNVADFLTGVTVPTERRIREGFENQFPRNKETLREAYKKSTIFAEMTTEYDYPDSDIARERTKDFKEGVSFETSKQLAKNSPFTVGFIDQVKACVSRQYQILWGDKATFIIKQVATLLQALIAGSLFYNAPDNSSGLFVKSGALFFSLLYNSLLAMSEVTDSFSGRPVLVKHKEFAYFHPAAFCIAQITADIPVLLFQISMFSLVVYFMVGLTMSAGTFFTYWVMVFCTTMCMTALFRAIGAAFTTFDGASKVSGFLISALIMYNGYMISKPEMHPWFGWIFWLDPLAYGFEALLSNEFHGTQIPCVNSNLVPNGVGYNDSAHQACTGVGGAEPGATFVTGDQYLSSLSYSHSHLWRNFGINWAWWVLFVAITIYSTTKWKSPSESGSCLVIPRERLAQHQKNSHNKYDEEAAISEKASKPSEGDAHDESNNIDGQLVRNTSVFTWKNLCYTVKTPTGDRLLLDNVFGWVKPGMLGALMGSSGAGKTTLLDVLAQRKTDGTINGSILVDGRELPVSFQRSAGYCEQLDVLEPFATVRESLEFSALLRQDRNIPDEEKLQYVDTIIDLLELHDLADTLVGRIGAGLSVEQRKRVTIGVELVSKPSILIFLDEPTSGLDGQSAYNTVRFLRKLADVGQAVLVTIHQPSAQLFAEFDTLLLLAKGGKTVYFGDIGDNGSVVKEYFSRYGAPCPTEANPAEHMIDVVSGTLSQGRDWNKVWLESPDYTKAVQELDQIIETAASKPPGTTDDGEEFATTLWTQIKMCTARMSTALYRNCDYVNNKMALHIGSALFNGFSFWMIKDSVSSLQLRLFTIFNFIFVAPGVIAQLQPLFIERRSIYEQREKKSKMYSWIAFVTALVVSEIPYLIICGVLYFVCWYYTVGFSHASDRAGGTFLVMFFYEFVYTGIGQFIAAYAPNATFASLVNPLVIGTLVSFCGVLVPYAQIQEFWRYWIYWMNPFNYLMGGMLVFSLWDEPVNCKESEFAIFDPLNGSTCAEYLKNFLETTGSSMNLVNPDATESCRVCEYKSGSDYLYSINLKEYYYGWRDMALTALFAVSSYCLVFLLMKLRTKASKKAE
ncbi:ABC multidrug transporter atrF [Penicillium taxi]|uniref:ABC multidrug transporter atrF n=1 Tax=Penicillium taxi TaxID=168475 RepID=UPI00254532E9|nr:ABC multidrug transporter atrF [Penicillium taxi]KAJ5888596.1 ABC multidrug transporter atrF [Penicillium taxi]